MTRPARHIVTLGGGGGGGACGGLGNGGGTVSANNDASHTFAGFDGHVLQTAVDPTALF